MQNDKTAEYKSDNKLLFCQKNTHETIPPNIWQTDIPGAQESTLRSILLTESDPLPEHAVPNWMKKKKSRKQQSHRSNCFPNQLLASNSPGIDMVPMIPVQEVFDESISDNTFQFTVDGNSVSLIDESTGEIIYFPDGIPEGLIPQEIILNHNLPVQSRKIRKQTLKHKKNLNELNISNQSKTAVLNQTVNISDLNKKSPTSNASCSMLKTLFTNKNRASTSKEINSEIVVLSDDSDCIELLSSDEDSEKSYSLKSNDDLITQNADHSQDFLQKISLKKSTIFQAQQEILEHSRLTHPREKSTMLAKQKGNSEIYPDLSNLVHSKLEENYTEISDSESSELPESILSPGMLCDGNAMQYDASNIDAQIIVQNTPERDVPESSEQYFTKMFIETKCNKAEPTALSCSETIEKDALVLCSTIRDKKTSLEYFNIKENFNDNPDTCESPSHLSFQNNTLNISNEMLKNLPENVNSNSTKHLLSNSNLDFISSLNFSNDHNTLSKSPNKCQTNNIETFSQISPNKDNSSSDYKINQEIILNNNENFNSDNAGIKTVVDISTSYCGNQLNSEDVTKIVMSPDVIDTTNILDKRYQDHFLKDQVSNDQYQLSGDKMVEFSEDKMTSLHGPLYVGNKSVLVNYSLQNIDKSSHSVDKQSIPTILEQSIVKSSCHFSANINLDIFSSDSINNEPSVTKSSFILTNSNKKNKFKNIKTTTGKKKHQQVLQRNTAIFLNKFDSTKSKESAEELSKFSTEINKLKNKECQNDLMNDESSQYNELKTNEFIQKNEAINEDYTQNNANIAFLESTCESSILVDTASNFTDNSSNENFISYNFKKVLIQVACSKNEFGSSQDNFLRGSSWSPDGQLILTNSNDNLLRVFKLPDDVMEHNLNHMDMKPIVRIVGGETVYSTDWYPFMNFANPDSCLFLSSSRDHPVHLWDAVTGEVRCSYRAFDQMDELTSALSVSFNADGSKIYAGFNNKIRIFESSRPGRDCIEMSTVGKKGSRKKTRMQHGIVSCISFPKQYNGCYALGSFSKTVGLYDCNTDENICVMHGHKGGITQVQFTNDGCYLFSGGRKDNEILCWDMRSTVEPVFKLSREVNTNQRIQFDIDRSDSYVFTGNTSHSIGFYNLHDVFDNLNDDECCFKPTRMFQAHEDVVNAVSLHPSLPLLVSTSGQRHFFVDDSSDSDSSGDTPTARKVDNSMRIWVI
ncbi:MATH and LRR domain-containing protein PFE0570w-like isoform X2 [Hydra vulgaris]|uniref:WD repeat-containing protein 79 n=1 Tax=Hydra vulgaris TaxID=6087 RepID=A0ABM4B6L1_HYDVU